MRSELANAGLRVAWGQWTALGVSGTAPIPDQAIDLEALVSFTPALKEDDPRLYEEALDWCVFHSQRLVSITRLQRLRAALPEEARDAYDDFAACVNATAKPKTLWPPRRSGTWTRTSEKSRPPQLDRKELLQLRLRCLFGVTSRAEVLLQFLRPGMVNELLPNMTLATSALDDIGYSRPALTEVLTDLTSAGLLEKWRRGNRDYYELTRREALLGLVGGGLPGTAPNWGVRFRVLAHLLAAEASTREKKPVVQTDAIIKVLDHYREVLERSNVRLPSHVGNWTELALWARETLLDEGRHAIQR
jgi:DNA-binding transcriptional ArsR family regulator